MYKNALQTFWLKTLQGQNLADMKIVSHILLNFRHSNTRILFTTWLISLNVLAWYETECSLRNVKLFFNFFIVCCCSYNYLSKIRGHTYIHSHSRTHTRVRSFNKSIINRAWLRCFTYIVRFKIKYKTKALFSLL